MKKHKSHTHMFKKTAIIIVTLVFSFSMQAQISQTIKTTVAGYPKSISNYKKLAGFIKRDFDNDHDKAAAIYVWIAENIAYDVKAFLGKKKSFTYSYKTLAEKALKEKQHQEKMVQTVFKSKKAVCEGYSGLYKQLCDLTDVNCVIISGDSKTMLSDIGRMPDRSTHAWNAVKIDGKWHLVDATWGAGSVDFGRKKFVKNYSDSYFFTNPEIFFLNHYPKNTDWLFTEKTKKDFSKLPLFHSNYIGLGLELILPTSGVITKAPNKKIKFKIKTEKNIKDLSFGFTKDKYATKIAAERKGDFLVFEIPATHKKSGYLTVYYLNKALISFKIDI